jgi:hypothetical protein
MSIEQIFETIIAGFFAGRAGVMLYDFLCFGEIFGNIKVWIAYYIDPKRVNEFMTDSHEMPKSEAALMANEMYDFIARHSMIMSLLDCKFCLCIWTALIFTIAWPGLPYYAFIPVAIISYLTVEKI